MHIFFGTDHAGFELKEELVSFVLDMGYSVEDKGAFEKNPEDDYPDFVIPVAEAVIENSGMARGIILGGSGQGEAITANRFPGIRAVVFNGQFDPGDGRKIPHEIELSREHNDSNILSLGARFLSVEEAKEAVERWLLTPFNGEERHCRRIKKIEEIAEKHCPSFYKKT